MASKQLSGLALRTLILEDKESDAELVLHELRRAGFDPLWSRVESEKDYLDHLSADLDLILADYSLPQYDALRALRALQERGLSVPFIIVSGTIGEDLAVKCMREGANDYLMKDRLSRLGPAVQQVLEERRLREEKRQVEASLQRQEQELGLLVRQLPAVVWCTDPQLRFTSSIGAGLGPLGLEPSGVLGMSLFDYFSSTDRDFPPIAAHLKALRGEPVSFETQWIDRLFQANVEPLRDPDGAVVGCIGVALDITERRREQAEMSRQLWHAAKLATMGELAASVAHELNNPLTTVSLRVESLLGQGPDGGGNRAPLQVIAQEVDRMGTLVASLLQFSRRTDPQISSLEMRDEIASALQLIDYQFRVRGIGVIQQIGPDVPMIRADRQSVRQLFLNVLTNASDAMAGGGTLTIRAATTQLNGAPAVRIEFADTGPGVRPEDLPKVMEPFYTSKHEGQGTGLGLPICRRIVEEHSGRIEILSPPGEGATVRIMLPMANDTPQVRA